MFHRFIYYATGHCRKALLNSNTELEVLLALSQKGFDLNWFSTKAPGKLVFSPFKQLLKARINQLERQRDRFIRK